MQEVYAVLRLCSLSGTVLGAQLALGLTSVKVMHEPKPTKTCKYRD